MASMPSKQALSLLISIETSRFSSSLPSSESLLPQNPAFGGEIRPYDGFRDSEKNLGFVIPCRNFHFSAAPLGFGASDAVRAESAVADFSDDEKAPGKNSSGADIDEGLEISKLGISQEIVSALAKKGITILFPIQVYSF